jgi:hypothetical protein
MRPYSSASSSWISIVPPGRGGSWRAHRGPSAPVLDSGTPRARGIDFAPGGVEVATPEADVDRLARHVGAGVLKPIMDGGGWPVATRSGEPAPRLQGVGHRRHARGDHRTRWDAAARAALDTVTWQGRSVRVPPLDLQVGYAG